jgi:imidazole glycerol phosphate synthase subunit HisF
MAKYYVQTLVTFGAEVEAETREEAEQKGWEWEDELLYEGVHEILIEEMDEDESDD